MVTLVSTLHDPEGRMVVATERYLRPLTALYHALVVVPTSATSPRLVEALQGVLVRPTAESNGAIGVGRRCALRLGLETCASHLHYCDFDRLLHWVACYPEELATLLETLQRFDYLMVGRTPRAFATHPRVQRDTEAITNHAFSLWFGEPVDVTAGSCGVSRRAAQLLLDHSLARTNATDAEWPALVRLAGGYTLGHARTEGLEFETPDYFADEIAAGGSLDRWLEERSRPLSAWVSRTRLALESLEAAQVAIDGRGALR